MMCFRDQTFCDSDCTNTACLRHLPPEAAFLNARLEATKEKADG